MFDQSREQGATRTAPPSIWVGCDVDEMELVGHGPGEQKRQGRRRARPFARHPDARPGPRPLGGEVDVARRELGDLTERLATRGLHALTDHYREEPSASRQRLTVERRAPTHAPRAAPRRAPC